MPEWYRLLSKFTEKQQEQLLKNISEISVLTGASEGLLDFYEQLLEEQYPDSTTFLEYLPNLVSPYGYEEVEPLKKNGSDKVRIGIIGNASSAIDTLSISEVCRLP